MTERADVWMPLYIGDYYRDTRRLTTEQHGAYFLLMMDYWTNGPPPNDDLELATICGLSLDAWSIHRAKLEGFFKVIGGQWRHKRIDAEKQKAQEHASRRSAKAKAAADARWNAESNARGIPGEQLGGCPPPSPSPSPSKAPAPSEEDADASSRAKREAATPEVRMVFDRWNEAARAGGFTPANKLTEDRRKKIGKLCKEFTWEEIDRGIGAIVRYPRLTGAGERGWKASLDWLLRPGNLNKLLDGDFVGQKRSAWDHVPEGPMQ